MKKRLEALEKSLTFEKKSGPRLHVWFPSTLCSLEAHGDVWPSELCECLVM